MSEVFRLYPHDHPAESGKTSQECDRYNEAMARSGPLAVPLVRALRVLLLLAWASTGWPGAQPRGKPDVILITIDTLRADYVGAYGSTRVKTPWLDSLAADGLLFENAYCQVPLTPPSHASILTGAYPLSHGLRDFTSGRLAPRETLATILKDQGYRTAAFVSALVLDRAWGLDTGFDLYYDHFEAEEMEGINPGNVQRRADVTIDQVLPWLEEAGTPFFLWVHLFDPHHDYDPPPPFNRTYRSDPYAGEVAFADRQLGRLLDSLKALGRYDSALIVATSDHGEALGEHGEEEHGFFLYESVLRVPLIFKLPAHYGLREKKEPAIAQTVDIVPTVLQILRIPSSREWGIEGRGLLSTVLGKRRHQGFAHAETLYPQTTFGWSALRAYRQGDYKFIEAPHPELYNLAQDPGERVNLHPTNSSLAHQLRQSLLDLERGLTTAGGAAGGGPDADTVERLRALGYVAISQPVPLRRDGRLEDPKEKVDTYNSVLEALQASEAGQPGRSNSILARVARSEPGLFIVHYSMGLNHLKLGQAESALSAFEKARSLNPDFTSTDVQSARALAALGRTGQAITLLEGAIQKEPANIASRRLLARLYGSKGDFPKAIAQQREIIRLRAEDRQAWSSLGILLVENRGFIEGLEALEHALALGAEGAQIRNSMGIVLNNLGRSEDAIASYRRAIEIKADFPLPRLNLALVLLQAGRREEALREFEELCRLSPQLCRRYRERFRR